MMLSVQQIEFWGLLSGYWSIFQMLGLFVCGTLHLYGAQSNVVSENFIDIVLQNTSLWHRLTLDKEN